MRFFYFKNLPLMVAPIPGLRGPDDPRLDRILERPPEGFGHKITENAWSTRHNRSIIESIQNEGQLHANVCYCQEPRNQWIVEPGQTRWLTMYHLKIPTQKVVVCVRDFEFEDFTNHFGAYEHEEIYDLSPYLYEGHVEQVLSRCAWMDSRVVA